MSFTYAIGDIHGRNDVLEKCIAAIAKDRIARGDETGEQTTIVFLGDYIDRGTQNKQVVETLMAGPQDKSRWQILRGNHEDMAIMAHADPNRYWRWWCQNGGTPTAMAWGGQVPDEVLKWFGQLPRRYTDRYRYYVHAGVNPGLPSSEQTHEMMLWIRHHRDEETPFDKYVVHGHTPYNNGPVMLQSRINLDVQSYRTGRAVIAVFDDAKYGQPIDVLEVRAGYTFNA